MSENKTSAFDFEYFETGYSAAPQRKADEKTKPSIKRVAPRTKGELKRQEIAGLVKSVRAFAFASVMFVMLIMQVVAGVNNYGITREIQEIERQIAIEQSENVRLSATLNGITGIAVIDNYATEILGMTKVENYQIECIDLSVGDTVLYTASLANKQ